MKLFNKFQSRAFQFVLDLLVQIKQCGCMSIDKVNVLADYYGLDYADQVVKPLLNAGIIEKLNSGYYLTKSLEFSSLPISDLEREYLQYILNHPQAPLFLKEETIEKMTDLGVDLSRMQSIQRYESVGELPPNSKVVFRRLLQAIRERRLVRNIYTTRDDDVPQESIVLPWKLEYDAIDYRWWVILYNPNEKRMVKARVNSVQSVELLDVANITDIEIDAAMERLLEPEPIVLRVNNVRGALERCFLVFESQLFEKTNKVSDDCFELTIRYYRFDRGEVLKKLLYLGPAVTLLKPTQLQKEMLAMVMQALNSQ